MNVGENEKKSIEDNPQKIISPKQIKALSQKSSNSKKQESSKKNSEQQLKNQKSNSSKKQMGTSKKNSPEKEEEQPINEKQQENSKNNDTPNKESSDKINASKKNYEEKVELPSENKLKKPETQRESLQIENQEKKDNISPNQTAQSESIQIEKPQLIINEQIKEEQSQKILPQKSILNQKSTKPSLELLQNLKDEKNILKPTKKNETENNFLIREKNFQPKDYLVDRTIKDEELEEQNRFEAERVLGHRFSLARKLFFLVKWKGWPHQFNSWEPEENFSNYRILLEEYIEKAGGQMSYFREYLETIVEFHNSKDPEHSKDKDISSYIYVLDKGAYLATAENLLRNDFHMSSQKVRLPHPDTSLTLGTKSKTNKVSISGAKPGDISKNMNLGTAHPNPENQKARNSSEKERKESKLLNFLPKEKSQKPTTSKNALMPKYFNNMCEPEKEGHKSQSNPNVVTVAETPARTRYFKLLKQNMGLDFKTRIQEKENSEDPALFGSFKFGDIPLRIIKMEVVAVLPKEIQLNCLIEWVNRKNGIKPKNSVYSNYILKQKSPLLLINYYESNIHIF